MATSVGRRIQWTGRQAIDETRTTVEVQWAVAHLATGDQSGKKSRGQVSLPVSVMILFMYHGR